MTGIYQTIFQLINQYIFGGVTLDVTSYEHLMCVVGGTIITVLLAAAPFIVVRWFFRGIAK